MLAAAIWEHTHGRPAGLGRLGVDSLLVPVMRLALSSHLYVGRGLDSDPIIRTYAALLLGAAAVALGALHVRMARAREHESGGTKSE